ncbi:MAG TPA: glycosyltransferase family 4 protein [Candidatus Didemnitutus sp.]|nr:glycosyltransferase family 4 protein [Candidatus Didemnitutus sp.]
MRMLLVCPEVFRADGGIARILRLYLKALCATAREGDEIAGVVLNDSDANDPRRSSYDGPALKTWVACGRRRLVFAWHVFRLARRTDRVICGHLHQLPLVRLAQKLNSRLNYCLIAHGIEVWRPYSRAERRALLGASCILCVSEYTRRQMQRFLPELDGRRLVVVPNALDPVVQAQAAPAVFPIPADGPRLLTVSRLSRADSYKGVDTLIEALPLVQRRYPATRLRVVGTGDDLPRLQELAAACRVSGSVEFSGRLDDRQLQAAYAACDLFALPSRREGFGLVFLEAMSHGKACLGARAGGIPEVVDDEVGALADYANISDLAAAVTDLVRHPRSPDLIRRRAESFGYEAFAQRLRTVLT